MGPIRHEDRSYRPSSPSPPKPSAPAPASRMDGPGGPPRLSDARTRRPESPSRIARRTSPQRGLSPIKDSGSALEKGGGSYRPDYNDDRDPREARRDIRDRDTDRAPASIPGGARLSLAERMGPRRGDSYSDAVSATPAPTRCRSSCLGVVVRETSADTDSAVPT